MVCISLHTCWSVFSAICILVALNFSAHTFWSVLLYCIQLLVLSVFSFLFPLYLDFRAVLYVFVFIYYQYIRTKIQFRCKVCNLSPIDQIWPTSFYITKCVYTNEIQFKNKIETITTIYYLYGEKN